MPKRRDQRGVRVNPLIASMTGRVVDTFLRKGRHKPGPEPVTPPTPPAPPCPPITCPCNMFAAADHAYQKLTPEERLVWRRALKKRKMSGYDLWMKECLVALQTTGYFPACPSVSGGFACHELVLSEERPTCENTIGMAPIPEPPYECEFFDDFTGDNGDDVGLRDGWRKPSTALQWYIMDNHARHTHAYKTAEVYHDQPAACGQLLTVEAILWGAFGKTAFVGFSVGGIETNPVGYALRIGYRTSYWPHVYHARLYAHATLLEDVAIPNPGAPAYFSLTVTSSMLIVKRNTVPIIAIDKPPIDDGEIAILFASSRTENDAHADDFHLFV